MSEALGGDKMGAKPTLKFSDLTLSERVVITNGCGPKGGRLKPPASIHFADDCDHHDFHYWRGRADSDRRLADLAFLRQMRRRVKREVPWYKIPWVSFWARAYYAAVRIHGRKYFHLSQQYRTREDIGEEHGQTN
jgi:hypothetical protein